MREPLWKGLTSCLVVFIVSFAGIVYTIDDYGMTWDDPSYIEHAERIKGWLGTVARWESPFSSEAFETYWNYDRHHNCHPPFYKLSGIFFKATVGRVFFDNVVYQYRISTAFWAAMFLSLFAHYFMRVYGKQFIAALAGLTFLLIPRFFAHTHFFATDMMVAALAFMTFYIYYFAANRSGRIGAAVFGGALLATKFTGVLIFPIILSFIVTSDNRRRFLVEYAGFVALSWLLFLAFNSQAWFDLNKEILFYFESVLQRETVLSIPTLYFGKVYEYRLPWHYPFVMFGITLPALVVMFCIAGVAFNLWWIRDKIRYFETVPLVVLLAVFAHPRVPKHDGIRLFSMAWPFIVIAAIRGISVLANCVERVCARLYWRYGNRNRIVTTIMMLVMVQCLYTVL